MKAFYTVFLCLTAIASFRGAAVEAQTNPPPECSVFDLSFFPTTALKNGLRSLRMQFTQISTTIRSNAPGDSKVQKKIAVLARQSDKALEQAFSAVDAYPSLIVSCPDESICTRRLLDEERERVILSARKLADVSVRLVNRFRNLLGEERVFVLEQIESRFNAFLDGIDFLPPFTFDCPGEAPGPPDPAETC